MLIFPPRYGQGQLAFLGGLAALFAAGILAADGAASSGLFMPYTGKIMAAGAGLAVFFLGLAIFLARRASGYFAPVMSAIFFLLGFLRYGASLGEVDFGKIARQHGGRPLAAVSGQVRAVAEGKTSDGKALRRLVLAVDDISLIAGEFSSKTNDYSEPPATVPPLENSASGQSAAPAPPPTRNKKINITSGAAIYVTQFAAKAGDALPPVKVGDRLAAEGHLRAVRGYWNPGRVDTARQAMANGISGRLTARKCRVIPVADENLPPLWRLKRQLAQIRAHYGREMEKSMPAADSAAIMAMMFGGYAGVEQELLDDFAAAGVIHILAVSGTHLALIIGLALALGRIFRLNRRYNLPLVIAAAVFYSALTGFHPPVVRAAIMAAAAALAFAINRQSSADGMRTLLVAAVALLIYEPRWLYSISFQLSFLAAGGLVAIAPPLGNWLVRHKWPRPLAAGLAVTAAVHLASLPAVAFYFHRLSLAAFLANLVVVPLAGVVIAVALAAGAIGLIFPLAMKIAFALASLAFGAMAEIAKLLAQIPGGNIYVPAFGALLTAAYYAALVFAVGQRGKIAGLFPKIKTALASRRAKLVSLVGAIIFPCAVFVIPWLYNAASPELAVHFADVGQGDFCLAITPHDRAVVFDTGGVRDSAYDIGARVAAPYLLHYGVTKIDYIFLTHAHADHAAGAGGLIRKFPVGAVITAAEPTAEYIKNMNIAPSAAKLRAAKQGEKFSVDGVIIETVYAPAAVGGNEASNVYRLSYGGASFLFTGDLVKAQEEQILAANLDVKSTVLKVAHHGSDSSSSSEFLRAVGAKWAAISAGEANHYGHPRPAVLDRLKASGAAICRTDSDGAIVFRTDGKRMKVGTFKR